MPTHCWSVLIFALLVVAGGAAWWEAFIRRWREVTSRQTTMWGRMQPRTLLFLTSTGAAVGASADAVEAVAAAAAINARVDAGRFDPGWATGIHRRLATTSSEATCDGVLSGTTCCSAACGECGGFDCSLRGNGAEDCCAEDVLERGILCSATGGAPPCILEGEGWNSRGGRSVNTTAFLRVWWVGCVMLVASRSCISLRDM